VPSIAPDGIACAGPLVWSEGIPERGHYCFVAVLSNAQDLAPDLASVTDATSFYELIRLNNNVVWKNFDVDNLFAGGYARIDFQIQGWPRQALKGDLEVDLKTLPAGVSAELRLLKRLLQGAILQGMTKFAETQIYAKLSLNGAETSAIRKMPLPPSDSTEAILQLTLPANISDGVYDVAIRQILDGKEVGRITRRLAVGQYPYTANRQTLEVHRSNCDWVQQMSRKNKVAYSDVNLAIQHGYNGCRFCLPDLSTD
jgi:hypothetical protein